MLINKVSWYNSVLLTDFKEGFYEFISRYALEVPPCQRHYQQGSFCHVATIKILGELKTGAIASDSVKRQCGYHSN